MGYREDVRAVCAGCAMALDDEDVTLDESGRSLCPACAAREGTARANQTLAIERGKRMTWVGVAVTVGAAVTALLTWRSVTKHQAEQRLLRMEAVEADATARIRGLGNRVALFAKAHREDDRDRTCEDAQLRLVARPGGQEFMTFMSETELGAPASRGAWSVLGTSKGWHFASDLDEARASLATFDASGVVVVFVPKGSEAAQDDDSPEPPLDMSEGTVVVMDVASGGSARCWARVRATDHSAPSREDLKAALAKITDVLDLAPGP